VRWMRGDKFRRRMRGGTRKKRGEGSLLVSFARGTRALRRASFDARSGETKQATPSRERKTSKLGKEGGAARPSSCLQSPHGETVVARCAQ
jgi:hypothetical protein